MSDVNKTMQEESKSEHFFILFLEALIGIAVAFNVA